MIVMKAQYREENLRKRILHLNLFDLAASRYPISTFFHMGYRNRELQKAMEELLFINIITEQELLGDPMRDLIVLNK